ncbi:MAG: hypothetical protein A3J49_12575 [Gallionellales bacterium RIFCSPHIGHO2_02_FULL_57_16]|nr:MAG: hypothetical protein A3J49_12575 [Gallionellales bacterium RIFCSPHIGHO2_02_FULL_57_16]
MMITIKQHIGFRQKLIALVLLAAFGQVQAEEVVDTAQPAKQESSESANAGVAVQSANILQPAIPESWVSFGLGGVSGDSGERALFGQYNGLRWDTSSILLDADVNKHDAETGVWTAFQGRNLGLDDRELRFSQKKQGDWKYSAEYSELTRVYPRTVSTGVQGIGSTNLTVNGSAAKTDVDLQTKRKSVTVGAEKWLTPSLQFEASFKSEKKDGARLFGLGINCGAAGPFTTVTCPTTPANGVGALLLLPEPIDSKIKQFDAKLNFSGEKYLLSAAYYGSFYTNANGAINQTITGLVAPNGGAIDLLTPGTSGAQVLAYMQSPTALPPDNQAHQLSLAGHYAFTPSTRVTFKYAKTHATQHENFDSMGLTTHPAGVNDLGGVLDTTLTQVGLTARPMAKLSVLANVRYEDKNDKTPLNLYSPSAGNTNGKDSLKRQAGKLEASYQLPSNYRATLGADYEMVNRGVPESTEKPGGLNMLREETRERGWRAELRGSMSETFNGGISYLNSQRNGSSWLRAVQGTPILSDAAAVLLGGASPYTVKDRQRDKLKLSADWTPTESLSLQFLVEEGKDKYTEPHLATLDDSGLKDTGVRLYSADAALILSDMWRLTGYASRGKQSNHVNMVNGASPAYKAELESTNTAVGIGLHGKPTDQLEVGADMSYMNDKNHYGQLQATTTVLPDVTFRQTTMHFFGKLALEKNTDFRVDLVHQRTYLGEWTWANNGTSFFYSDNTTVSMDPNQKVAFISATYIYKF